MAEWDIKTNRHTNNAGHSFGWIEKDGRLVEIWSNAPFSNHMSYEQAKEWVKNK